MINYLKPKELSMSNINKPILLNKDLQFDSDVISKNCLFELINSHTSRGK